MLITVFAFGFPIAKSPDDSMALTEFILIGELLNSSYFLDYSSYSSTLKASWKIG